MPCLGPGLGVLLFCVLSSGCGAEFVPLRHSVELATARCTIPLLIPANFAWPVLEIRRDGAVYLDEELMVAAPTGVPGEERDFKHLITGLVEKIKNAPKDPDSEPEEHVADLRLLVAVDKETPYSLVQETLERLRYRTVLISHVYLCVRGVESLEPMAIQIYIYQDIGISCGAGPKSISRVEWYGEEAEARGVSAPVLRLERTDEYLPGMETEPPPVILDKLPRCGDDLSVWLREGNPDWGLRSIEPLDGATWQDVVKVIDLALQEKLEWVGDYHLDPTLEVRAAMER